MRGIDMGMQCEGLSDGYTAGVLCLSLSTVVLNH